MATSQQAAGPEARRVLEFWLGEAWATAPPDYFPPPEVRRRWFGAGPEVDKEISDLFGADCEALASSIAQGSRSALPTEGHGSWVCGGSSGGGGDCGRVYDRLAAIIVADQFSRHVWRDTQRMFQCDPRALEWARVLVEGGQHLALRPMERVWVYMPFVHSEDLADQEEAVHLMEALKADGLAMGAEAVGAWAAEGVGHTVLHRDVIARYGRFPHRNALLGRPSTAQEEAGLADGSIPWFK